MNATTCIDPGITYEGEVLALKGSTVIAQLPFIPVGSLCEIHTVQVSFAIVSAFDNNTVVLLQVTHNRSITPGAKIISRGLPPTLLLCPTSPAGVFGFSGNSLISGEPSATKLLELALDIPPPHSIHRRKLSEQCITGIRSIDSLFPIAYGQRVALLAQPGVGKSTLLLTLTQNTAADYVVIGLIGERGREVNEFVEDILSVMNKSSVLVFVSTSDALPMNRWLTALAATRAAEYFRAQGKRVLLCIDSLTRCARAIREFSLSLGELPVRHGFTPSVYEFLPRLLERAGMDDKGSITAFYTLLSEESAEDPLSSEVISLLDGHFYLSKTLAQRGIYPALDPLRSISRLESKLTTPIQKSSMSKFIRLWSKLERDRDMLMFGENTADAELLLAAKLENKMTAFLTQSKQQYSPLHESLDSLQSTLRE